MFEADAAEFVLDFIVHEGMMSEFMLEEGAVEFTLDFIVHEGQVV